MKTNEGLNAKHIHMIGIGGSSMSGLALLMKEKGYHVTGSDKSASHHTDRLQHEGIRVFIGHSEENVFGADLVVYSAAIKSTNPERIGAEKSGIPQIERCELIEKLMDKDAYSVCVSGTNGKTTTTAMLAQAFIQAGADPTIHIGGDFDFLGGGTRCGTDGGFILEACEYNSSFLHFTPTIAIVTNITEDHLEYYGTIDNIEKAFREFVGKIPQDGWCIACGDDVRAQRTCLQTDCRHITYGLDEANDLIPAELSYDEDGKAEFNAMLNGKMLGHFHIGVPGEVNMLNSLAVIAACYIKGLELRAVSDALHSFSGARRRFEYTGITDGVSCYTDYGHNPVAIKNALKIAAIRPHREIWSVFQPHTFSRTKYLFEDFLSAFNDADHVLITDIFAAREMDPGDIHAEMLVESMRKNGIDAHYAPDFDAAETFLRSHWQTGDMMISHGCGNINLLNEQMTGRLFLSVIITAYNIEKYIRDCIQSVQEQTFADFECIIVDDGSADGTSEVIRHNIRNDSRFRLLTIPHGGPQKAKNAGLAEARGEYVVFADGDDTLAPECLKECLEKAEGVDLLIFGINYQDYTDGKLISEKPLSLPTMEFASGSELADWYIENRRLLLYSNANKLYKRETLQKENIRFRDELSFGEDRIFNFDFLRVCKKIAVLPGVYYNYRGINSYSLTCTFRHHHIDELLPLHEQKFACMCEISEKASEQAKEKFRKADYDKCFYAALDMIISNKDNLSGAEYAEELAYLESRFVPSVSEAPFRFYLEHAWRSREKRVSDFLEQIRTFKSSDAMQALIAILDEAAQKTEDIKRRFECADDYAFLCQFGTRKGERQQSLNTPSALRIDELLREEKECLYHALYDLGFIANNRTYFESYDYLLILGGANDANRLRTKKAMEIADELIGKEKKLKLIAGVSTYRRLAETEHKVTDKYAYGIEYEFDIISKCIENELFASGGKKAEQITLMEYNDADPTFSSKIIEFSEKYKGCTVGNYCAPKRNQNVQRADTEDCLEFFLQHSGVPEGSTVLLVTSNIYCGSNFKASVGIEHGINLDIVGNWPDDLVDTPEKMNCSRYINELIKMYGEFSRIEAKYR